MLFVSSIWFQFQAEAKYPARKHIFHNLVPYGADVLLGFGGSILLVTSLSMTADLIGPHIVSGARAKDRNNKFVCMCRLVEHLCMVRWVLLTSWPMALPYKSSSCVIRATNRSSEWTLCVMMSLCTCSYHHQGVLQCLSHVLSSGDGIRARRTISSSPCCPNISGYLYKTIQQTIKFNRWVYSICIILKSICMLFRQRRWIREGSTTKYCLSR